MNKERSSYALVELGMKREMSFTDSVLPQIGPESSRGEVNDLVVRELIRRLEGDVVGTRVNLV